MGLENSMPRGRKRVLTPRQRSMNDQAVRERWRKANTRIINVRFNVDNDAEVLEKLDSVENKADYIRQLIIEDIKK